VAPEAALHTKYNITLVLHIYMSMLEICR